MSPVKQLLARLLRAYAVWGALLVCLALPGTLFRLNSIRIRPVRLDSIPAPDGSLTGTVVADGRRARFASVSIADGPRVPAGGVVAVRLLPDLPAGTRVSYFEARARSPEVVVSGAVEERGATAAQTAAAVTLALLAVVLVVTGAGIAIAGVSTQALAAGAALAGLGHFAGAQFLEANASLVADPAARNAVVLAWVAFPRHFAFLALAAFLALFPFNLAKRRFPRLLLALLAAIALVEATLVPLFQVPGVFDGLTVSWQARLVGGVRHLIALLFGAGSLGALLLIALQIHAFRNEDLPLPTRRRAVVVGAGLLAGLGPPLVLGLVQLLSKRLAGRQPLPQLAMVASLLPILVVPAVLAYAMLAPRVLSVGLLARKALLLGFAQGTVRAVSLAPLGALGFLFYTRRTSPIGQVFAEHPLFILLTLAAAILGLRYGDRTRGALERFFFRPRGASPRTLAQITEETRRARDVTELAELLSSGVERALLVEQTTLWIRDERSGSFVCTGRSLPPIDGTSALVDESSLRSGPFRVDPGEKESAPRGLTEIERDWVETSRTRLVVPLKGSGGQLLALLAVGEKLSEMPFEAADEDLLATVATSGALALENLLLRSSQGSSGGSTPTGTAPPAGEGGEDEAARACPRCARLFPAAAGGSCPDDASLLEIAPVPHLLAGKFRLDRRIGAGGMGLVYRARDLSLGRDVAIKTLPRLSPEGVRRLQREARAAARLIHPNLGLIFSAESWQGTPMLVLEYLSGGTLADRIRRAPVPPDRAVAWCVALAGGLEALHARGLLHRDIKPSNVGFSADGAPKLLDFGLVRLLDEPDVAPTSEASGDDAPSFEPGDRSTLTASSRVVGTVPYLSPEALQGRPPSPGFDLWGLSLTLYEAVTCVNPFFATSNSRSVERILTVPVPDPRGPSPECPQPLAELLLEALARSEEKRPASARELRLRLEAVAASLPAPSPERASSTEADVPSSVTGDDRTRSR